MHFGRRWLVCCSLSILHVASSSSCLDIWLWKVLRNWAGDPSSSKTYMFLGRESKVRGAKAGLGKAEVFSLQHWGSSVTYGGCTMWNARSKTPLIPLCLLDEVKTQGEVLAEAGRPGEPKAGGGTVPSLINVIDGIIWLGAEWLPPAGCQFRSSWANYRSRAVCYLHPKCLRYPDLCAFEELNWNWRLFGSHKGMPILGSKMPFFLLKGDIALGWWRSSGSESGDGYTTNVLNAPELCTYTWLKWYILCYVYFTTIEKKERERERDMAKVTIP